MTPYASRYGGGMGGGMGMGMGMGGMGQMGQMGPPGMFCSSACSYQLQLCAETVIVNSARCIPPAGNDANPVLSSPA